VKISKPWPDNKRILLKMVADWKGLEDYQVVSYRVVKGSLVYSPHFVYIGQGKARERVDRVRRLQF